MEELVSTQETTEEPVGEETSGIEGYTQVQPEIDNIPCIEDWGQRDFHESRALPHDYHKDKIQFSKKKNIRKIKKGTPVQGYNLDTTLWEGDELRVIELTFPQATKDFWKEEKDILKFKLAQARVYIL